jgi:ABC-type glycerol-3-phosphate transport system substrate-binding protein
MASSAQSTLTRRNVLRLSALSSIALGLAACSDSNSSGKPTGTLNVWTWSSAAQVQATFKAMQATYPSTFRHAKINVQTAAADDASLAEKLNLTFTSHGQLPDIIKLDYNELAMFAGLGVLEDLTQAFGPYQSDLYTGAKVISNYNGKAFAFPAYMNGKLFYYRKDIFNRTKIDPAGITDLDTYIAAGKKLVSAAGTHIINIGPNVDLYKWGMVASAYPGVTFTTKSDNYANIGSNPVFAKVFEFWRAIDASGIAYPANDFDNDWAPAIHGNKICSFLSATWMTAYLPQYATLSQKGLWVAAPWPKFTPDFADQTFGSDVGGAIYVVPKNAPNKDMAVEFLTKARLDPKGSMAVFKATGVVSNNRSNYDPTIQYFNSATKPAGMSEADWQAQPAQYFGVDYYKQMFASFDRIRTTEYSPKDIEQMNILDQWFVKVVSGSTTVAGALQGMRQAMQGQVGNPYQ